MMMPWEREIYVGMLIDYVKEENDRLKQIKQSATDAIILVQYTIKNKRNDILSRLLTNEKETTAKRLSIIKIANESSLNAKAPMTMIAINSIIKAITKDNLSAYSFLGAKNLYSRQLVFLITFL